MAVAAAPPPAVTPPLPLLQDCYGGCTDPVQGYYGLMDEVRIWSTVLTQTEILQHMRWASGLGKGGRGASELGGQWARSGGQ